MLQITPHHNIIFSISPVDEVTPKNQTNIRETFLI